MNLENLPVDILWAIFERITDDNPSNLLSLSQCSKSMRASVRAFFLGSDRYYGSFLLWKLYEEPRGLNGHYVKSRGTSTPVLTSLQEMLERRCLWRFLVQLNEEMAKCDDWEWLGYPLNMSGEKIMKCRLNGKSLVLLVARGPEEERDTRVVWLQVTRKGCRMNSIWDLHIPPESCGPFTLFGPAQNEQKDEFAPLAFTKFIANCKHCDVNLYGDFTRPEDELTDVQCSEEILADSCWIEERMVNKGAIFQKFSWDIILPDSEEESDLITTTKYFKNVTFFGTNHGRVYYCNMTTIQPVLMLDIEDDKEILSIDVQYFDNEVFIVCVTEACAYYTSFGRLGSN